MVKKLSHGFMVAGIRNILKRNYGIDPQTIDVFAHVDPELTFQENWNSLKQKFLQNQITFEYFKCKKCAYIIKIDWIVCPKCTEKLT